MNRAIPFNLSYIHKVFWKEFCDVCYTRFNFEDGEERSYEQKYETFCRCKLYVTEDKDYEQQLFQTKEEDVLRLKHQVEVFYDLRDARDMIPSLYALVTMVETVIEKLKSDTELIRYMCPRKTLMNYDNMHISIPKEWREDIVNDCQVDRLTSELQKRIIETIDLPPFINGCNISDGVKTCARRYLTLYEGVLIELESVLPTEMECNNGNELQAFLYRLFMSYEDSLPSIREQLEELPIPMNLYELRDDGIRIYDEFIATPLGCRWLKCMKCKDGLKHFAHFFMHQRKGFTMAEEQAFFYNLDKLCIIEDILNGNANKYWLDINYPEDWNIESNEQDANVLEYQNPKAFSENVLSGINQVKHLTNALQSTPANVSININVIKGDQVMHKDANIDKNFGPVICSE